VSDATVEFNGGKTDAGGTSSINGTIDRVTGATQVWAILSAKDGKIIGHVVGSCLQDYKSTVLISSSDNPRPIWARPTAGTNVVHWDSLATG
jgi:hypothetical protein